ncbi:unnamed protein product, partial [Ixodes pacificus]
MPRTCAAESCFKNFSLCEMPCHKFPKDEKLCALWSRLARPSFPTWVPTNIDRLCGYHFSDEDYIWNPKLMKRAGLSTKNMRLKPGVVPSVFSKKGSSDQLTRPLEKRSEAAPLFDATDVQVKGADACWDTRYKAAESSVSTAILVGLFLWVLIHMRPCRRWSCTFWRDQQFTKSHREHLVQMLFL